MTPTPAQLAKLTRLKLDLPFFAGGCLSIRGKDGRIARLQLNRPQRWLHQRLEVQRAATGKVRALVLKARQQGLSTYIGARFYHRSSMRRGRQVFILAHEQGAADNLFDMVGRFHASNPLAPATGSANARSLSFPGLDSGYMVGTAGSAETGRSRTIQYLHGSEAAFWKNAPGHFAGLVQAVPDQPGTEIILESTGDGPQGEFFERWRQAEAGVGDYAAVFVPWFWSADYRRLPPAGFALDEAEADYAALHGLDLGQMAWRRAKLAELRDPMLFMQEYPATAVEAFASTGHDSFIRPAAVLAARKSNLEGVGPLVVGVDPKREGSDRFAIAWRRGRKLLKVTGDPSPVDTLTAAGRIKTLIDEDHPARVFMDVGGNGGAIADVLSSWGEPYASRVRLVNFGSAPLEGERILPDGSRQPGPRNRRAEMWSRSRDWLQAEGGADLPDLDALQADACAPGYSYDMSQRLVLESKERMAARGARSPDLWDAVTLTFAEPVAEPRSTPLRPRSPAGGWMA